MQEIQFREHFDVVRNDVTAATSAFYTYMEINKFASEGQENYNKINRDAYFWMGQLYALQTTWFIVLGRLFDRGGYSIRKFLAATVAHKDLFSKGALAERKREAARQDNPEWLDEYLRTAWEPTAQDLQAIADSELPRRSGSNPTNRSGIRCSHITISVYRSMTYSGKRWSVISKTSCMTSIGYG